VATPAGRSLPEVAHQVESVAPGVEHIHEFHTSGPLNIHILKVDLRTSGVTVSTAFGKNRLFTGATVEEMARWAESPLRHVLGAVNADFWKNAPAMFTPVNLYVADEMAARLPVAPAPRAVFGRTTDGKYFIKPLTARLEVRGGGQLLTHVKLNEPVSSSGAVLFTRHYGTPVKLARFKRAYLLELVSPRFVPNEPAQARVIKELECTTASVSGRNLVLALHSDAARQTRPLRPGTMLKLDLRVPEIKEGIELAVGGAPQLLRDGKPYIDWREEKVLRSFAADRHPRTAVKISRDGSTLFLVTVDGRQPAVSIGMSLYELALYLKELGCWNAMNFDGGGSTTMVVRGDVVNKPSDRFGPRTVVNALMIVAEGPTGPIARLEFVPKDREIIVPRGSRQVIECRGRDAMGNPVALEPADLIWDIDQQLGRVETSGTACILKAGEKPTSGMLRVLYKKYGVGKVVRAELPMRIVEITSATVEPCPIVLSRGEQVALTVRAFSGDSAVTLTPDQIETIPENDCVTVTRHRVRGVRTGEGCLTVAIGAYQHGVPYCVDKLTTVVLHSFDEKTTRALAGTRFAGKRTNVRLDTSNKVEGKGSLAWHYAMTRGGTSKIILPVDVAIPGRPARLAISIYGDGKEAWLRGEIVDAAGNHFLIDFTDGSTGITWKNAWKKVTASLDGLVPRPMNPGAKPVFPLRLTELYLAQDQEALKAEGEIHLDALEALYPSFTSHLQCSSGCH
jgi:hypothetical protein